MERPGRSSNRRVDDLKRKDLDRTDAVMAGLIFAIILQRGVDWVRVLIKLHF